MTGDEHFREAERLLASSTALMQAATTDRQAEATVLQVPILQARAQVHATLALAAATLDAAFVVGAAELGFGVAMADGDRGGWGYGR